MGPVSELVADASPRQGEGRQGDGQPVGADRGASSSRSAAPRCDRALDSLEVPDVEEWLAWLQERRGRRGNRSLSGGALRHYLNALSNMYRRAQAERVVPPGDNPAAAMLEKPTASRESDSPLRCGSACSRSGGRGGIPEARPAPSAAG